MASLKSHADAPSAWGPDNFNLTVTHNFVLISASTVISACRQSRLIFRKGILALVHAHTADLGSFLLFDPHIVQHLRRIFRIFGDRNAWSDVRSGRLLDKAFALQVSFCVSRAITA
jgi:hypothetical protein